MWYSFATHILVGEIDSMRIAIMTEGYYPELSGVTVSLHHRLRWLSRWGHTVRVYAPDYSPLAGMYPHYHQHRGEVLPGVTVVPFPSVPYYVNYARDPKPFSFSVVEADLRTFKPDVIHAECPERLFMGWFARPGIKLARRMKVPATAIYHTNYLAYIEDYKQNIAWLRLPGIQAALLKLIVTVYNSYHLTMVPSHITGNFLKRSGVRNTRVGAFNGVDTDLFHPNGAQPLPAFEALGDRLKVLYVGRLTPDKNIDLLLAAFDRVRAQTERCGFILVGGGPEEERVRAWANSPDALYLGRLPHEALPPLYGAADVFVTASLKENQPLSLWEAMACGLPVVGPAAGGLPEMIQPDQNGALARPSDPDSLAEQILRLVRDPDLRRRMGQQASQQAAQRSWEACTRRMLTIWEECVTAHA